MPKVKNRIVAIARKEFLHIINDKRSLLIIIVLPTLMLILFGYALNMEIENVDLAVIDNDRTALSQNLIDEFGGSDFFRVAHYTGPVSEIEGLFMRRDARVVMIIDKHFSRSYQRQPQTPVQIIIDGSDPNAATLIRSYCTGIIFAFNTKYSKALPVPFDIKPRIWYNPDFKSSYFFVPGLIALILIMISALLTSITITREKELGTMEQILVSPVKPREIILGKVLPYIVLAFIDGFLILVLGMILFDIPFKGSYLLLLILSLIYILTSLSFGLMISTIVQTQQVAMMIAITATLLPTIMLSGFIFPINSMPVILQYISYIVPAKYFIFIIRGILLKGNSFMQLLAQTAFLTFFTLIMLRNAVHRFSTNLEK
jgi:ABC-2 type transport system permease protein